MDCYGLSKYDKHPSITVKLREEIEQVKSALQMIVERSPTSKLIYCEGNHEERFKKYILKNAVELYDLLDFKRELGLDEMRIKFIPFHYNQGHRVLDSDIIVRHSPVSCSENFAMASIKKASCSLIVGHLHQMQTIYRKTIDGRDIVSVGTGCLCDLESPVFDYLKNFPQWKQGFCVVTKHGDNFFINNVEIKSNEKERICLFDGNIWHS